jgi:hypothetical protein
MTDADLDAIEARPDDFEKPDDDGNSTLLELVAEVRHLRRDQTRLDFIEANEINVVTSVGGWLVSGGGDAAPTVRLAVDAEIQRRKHPRPESAIVDG